MFGIIGALVLSVLLSIPVLVLARSDRKLTWAGAIGMGTLLVTVSMLLIAEIPSRILYLFSAQHGVWAKKVPFLGFLAGDSYFYYADIVANTVQGLFFVIIVAAVYIWGERQRKSGRFKP